MIKPIISRFMPGRWPHITEVFQFGDIYVLASIVRPYDSVMHIGGNHTDSPFPKQKWKSVDEAFEKVSAKARDMEVKNRIHGLPYAGWKSAIFAPYDYLRGPKRKELFLRLADVLNYYNEKRKPCILLRGAVDVETDSEDVHIVYANSPYVVGIGTKYGGCGDASVYTALGICNLIKQAIERGFIGASPDIQGKTVAIPGAAGKVGRHIVSTLYEWGLNLVISDINEKGVNVLRKAYPGVNIRPPEEIHKSEVHILCPSDTKITIPNKETIEDFHPFLQGIIGPANDQCRSQELADMLFYRKVDGVRRRIWHFDLSGALPNGGGLIAVAGELDEGGFIHERVVAQILGGEYNGKRYYGLVEKGIDVLAESERRNIPPYKIVEEMFLST